jgi:hypothetical protein
MGEALAGAADHVGEALQDTADQVGEALAGEHATADQLGATALACVAVVVAACGWRLGDGSGSHDSSHAVGIGPAEMSLPGPGAVGLSARRKRLVLSCPLRGC